MKLVYVYEKNNKNVVGYVKGLHTDGYSDKMYYSITFPRTGATEYIDINDMFRDEDGMLYYEKDNCFDACARCAPLVCFLRSKGV